jgi:predicted nuclease of restriction endonuclease-like (RecB) superfamily
MKKHQNSDLLDAVKQLIEESRHNVALSVNAQMTSLHYRIGQRINQEILKDARSEYGKKVIRELSVKLIAVYGPGWGEKQLRHCIKFESVFPNYEIVYALRRQLSWTHFRTLMYIESPLKRDFYIEMCKIERWSSRQLQERIQSMLYERTAISKKPEEVIINELQLLKSEQKLNPDLVFKDPYFLDFLGLKDAYSEKDLEASIIVELQRFIIEMGTDFAFMARQKRITIDQRDYFIDLLFYHRRLKCLVVVDLKMGEFEAGFKGQMELYLRFLEKYEKVEGENDPIGLILCSGKSSEHIELMQLGKSNIRVADYLTALPSQQILQEKLHKAVEIARHKMEQRDFSNAKTGLPID